MLLSRKDNISIFSISIIDVIEGWKKDSRGNVVTEAAFIFPILLAMLMGAIDIGTGLLINKKVLSAAHMTADLVAREESLSNAELDNYVEAARLALVPYSLDSFGIDVAGIRFVDASADPEIKWRDTIDMTPPSDIEAKADGLGKENEGVVVVTVEYTFTPQFSSVITGPIKMQETAFVKGRVTSFVNRE